MNSLRRSRKLVTLATIIALLCALTACATKKSAQESSDHTQGSTGSFSRVSFYSSIEQMAADSNMIVTGTVADTTTTRDIDDYTDFTISTVNVLETIKGDTHDANEIMVRQTGSQEQHSPETLLSTGDTVLLFLVHSDLDGELAKQYYVTGATAGVYRMNGAASPLSIDATDNASFHRVNTDSGDDLPDVLSVKELRNSIG